MCDDQHEWQLLPIWYCQLTFCFLPSTSVHICHHWYHFQLLIYCYHFQLHKNHASWHVSYSSLQRRKECAFLWGIRLFRVVFALKVIRVMIIHYPTNKLMHLCNDAYMIERSAYGNTSYNVHTNSLHHLHRQSTPRNGRSFLRMRIICSISWNHEWGGVEKLESTLVLHFWWYQRQTRLIDQLWLIFEKRGTR